MANKQALLPLVPKEGIHEVTKENSTVFLLKTCPVEDDSPTYKKSHHILNGSEILHQVLQWRATTVQVLARLKIGDVANALPLLKTMMHSTVLTLFQMECTCFGEGERQNQMTPSTSSMFLPHCKHAQ